MGLSSNSIIHLTKTKENLIGILKSNFNVKYCFENLNTKKGTIKSAYPMVSFCDIPLSELKNHISKYGNYGVGLKKEWAQKNGLNPVLYIDKFSDLGANFRDAAKNFFVSKEFENFDEYEKASMDLIRYMKNYESKLIRNDEIIENYRFSDEREWRYILDFDKVTPLMTPNVYTKQSDKDKANENLKDFKLEFEPNDINYIIIESEEEISEFIDVLRKSKSKNYTMNDVERLMTRMITTEQILGDF